MNLSRLVMTFSFMFALGVSTYADVTPGTSENQQTIIWTTVVGFLSLLATQVFAMWREYRNRRWDLENRKLAREELDRKFERQAGETVATAVQLARLTKAHHEEVTSQLEKNTELTRQASAKAEAAYEAGNNYTQRLNDLRAELFGKKGQLDHIEEVAEDTQGKVTHIVETTTAKEKEV